MRARCTAFLTDRCRWAIGCTDRRSDTFIQTDHMMTIDARRGGSTEEVDCVAGERKIDMTTDILEMAGRRWLLRWERAMLEHAAMMRVWNTTR